MILLILIVLYVNMSISPMYKWCLKGVYMAMPSKMVFVLSMLPS